MGGAKSAGKVRIIIKCSPELKKEFRMFALNYRNYEQALKALLDRYKNTEAEVFG